MVYLVIKFQEGRRVALNATKESANSVILKQNVKISRSNRAIAYKIELYKLIAINHDDTIGPFRDAWCTTFGG